MAVPSLPLDTPPSGGDRNKGWVLLVVGIIFTTIGTMLVLARLYLRSHIKKNLGLDDLFILLGLISCIVCVSLTGVMVHYGVGRHQFYIEASPKLSRQYPRAIELLDISQIIIILSTMFTRVSICFFLLRIFGSVQSWKRSLYCIVAFTVAVSIVSVITALVQCSPPQKTWNPLIPGTCWSGDARLAVGRINGAFAVSCDWALASLPIIFMWRMQMSIKTKLGICTLMGMGFFSGICAIVRTVLWKENAAIDVSWNVVSSYIFALLETTVGIIAACIPTVKPLFDKAFRCTRSWNRKLAGEGPGQLRGGDDDRRRLQPALQSDVPLDTFPTGHIPYLGDSMGERTKVEIMAGGQGDMHMEAMGLGTEDIRMDTEFGTHRGDHEDDFESV